jgi:hypothetical protein
LVAVSDLCLSLTVVQSARADDPPVIDEFYVMESPANVYIIVGHVSDDGPVDELLVTFGGIFDEYGLNAVCDANGDFECDAICYGLQSGFATADTVDYDDEAALVAWYYVLVTP